MKTISKPMRATEEIFRELKLLAVGEGKTMGKMLAVLIQAYKKQQEVKEDGYISTNQK